MGWGITIDSNGGVTVDTGGSGGGGVDIIPTIISGFNDLIKAGSDVISSTGDATTDAIKSGGEVVRDIIDTTVTGIEDTANEIGRIDDNILGGISDKAFETVSGGFKNTLQQFGDAIFKSAPKGENTNKDTSNFSTDILSGGFKKKGKKGKVSSGMGLQMSMDTGLQS